MNDWTRLRVAALLLSAVACRVTVDLPSSLRAACENDGDCPKRYRCEVEAGLCVPARSDDLSAPSLDGEATIDPHVVGMHQSVTISFVANEPLLVEPTIALHAGALISACKLVAEEGDRFTFRYLTDGSEPEGEATLFAHMIDGAGNSRADVLVGEVTLDFTPPQVNALVVESGVAHDGTRWIDSSSVAVAADVIDAVDGSDVTAIVDGDVATPLQAPFADPLVIDVGDATDGVKNLVLAFRDGVGNTSVPQVVSVVLERTTPSNVIVIDDPPPPSYVVNADVLRLTFHSEGELPSDFVGYVVSTDFGATWSVPQTVGEYLIDPLAENTSTTVWVREQDVFGLQTPTTAQGELQIREDSIAPAKPLVGSSDLVGNFGSGVGLYLAAASYDEGGQVTYEAVGGAHPLFAPVGTAPWFYLPGVGQETSTGFIFHARDEAGNVSDPEFVRVVDSNIRRLPANACTPISCFNRSRYRARTHRGIYYEYHPSSGSYALIACSLLSPRDAACDYVVVEPTPDTHMTWEDLVGRHLVFIGDVGGSFPGVHIYDLGADLIPGSADDVGPTQLTADGSAVAVAETGTVYLSTLDQTWRYYDFGADRLYGTFDAGEGETTVPGATVDLPDVAGRNRNDLQFNGRHLLWRESGSGSRAAGLHLIDLGADRTPSTGDGEADMPLPGSSDAWLCANRAYIDGAVIDFGEDGAYGTGDDPMPIAIDDVVGLAGDKVLRALPHSSGGGVVLHDISTGFEMPLTSSQPIEIGLTEQVSLAPGMIFLALHTNTTPDLFPGFVELRHLPGYVWSTQAGGRPGGHFSGSLGVLFHAPDDDLALLRNFQRGFGWWPADGWQVFDDLEANLDNVDVDGTRVVYTDTDGEIWIFDVGTDQEPSTTDDVGPAKITDGPAVRRWPRISGSVVVWADLSADGDGEWLNDDLDSRIRAVDLGDDGWPGGGDDIPYDVTDGGKEIMPDVSGNTVVWVDFRTPGADVDGLCPTGKIGIDPVDCTSDIYSTTLGAGTETVIEDNSAAQVGVQIEGDLVVWNDYRSGNWDVFVHRLGGATRRITDTPEWETSPCIVDSRLGYFRESPVVIDAGDDGDFGTADDEAIIGPQPDHGSFDEPFLANRARWLVADFAITSDRLLPLVGADVIVESGAVDRSIPDDDPVGVEESISMGGEAWERVFDISVIVQLTHPDTRELVITLISPSNDHAMVFDGALEDGGADLDVELDIMTSPFLLNHIGEPIAGIWTLRVVDRGAASAGGTLHSWGLRHRR